MGFEARLGIGLPAARLKLLIGAETFSKSDGNFWRNGAILREQADDSDRRGHTDTREAALIARIRRFSRYSGNLKRARQNFREDYGFSHDDKKRVDREIVKRLEDAKDNLDQFEVTLPVELVIALTLRDGFDSKGGRPEKSDWEQRKLESAIRNFWFLKAKYRAQGLSLSESRERAIKEAASAETGGVNESILRDQMGRKKYAHLRLNGPTHKFEL